MTTLRYLLNALYFLPSCIATCFNKSLHLDTNYMRHRQILLSGIYSINIRNSLFGDLRTTLYNDLLITWTTSISQEKERWQSVAHSSFLLTTYCWFGPYRITSVWHKKTEEDISLINCYFVLEERHLKMVLKTIVRYIINRYLKNYIEQLDDEKLNFDLKNGRSE